MVVGIPAVSEGISLSQTQFQPSFSDFQTLNPTSDIINVYSDVLKIRIFFVSGTVKWLSIIVYLEDA